MEIITTTQNTIAKKTAYLQKQEHEWTIANGGELLEWQTRRLKQGVEEVQLLQNLVAHIQSLIDAATEKPLTAKQYALIKYHYTDKDILLRRLIMLIESSIIPKEGTNQLTIKVHKTYFLGILKEIYNDYKTLINGNN